MESRLGILMRVEGALGGVALSETSVSVHGAARSGTTCISMQQTPLLSLLRMELLSNKQTL